MRQGNARIGSCKVGFVLAALAFAGAAWAGEVRSLALEHGATGTRAEIDLHGAGQYKTLSLAGPDRLVLDLPDSHAARSLKLPAPTGVVAAVRTGQPVPGTLRIVFELSAPVNALPLRVEPSADGARLAIHWPGDGTVPAPMASALPQAAAVATTAEPVAPASASTASPLDILEGRTPGSGEGTVAAGTPATGLASAPVEAELTQLQVDASKIELNGKQPIPLRLSARIGAGRAEPGRLAWRGQFSLEPLAAQGTLEAQRLPVHAFEPYFGDALNIDLLRADTSLQGQVAFTQTAHGPR
ncbi:MAG: DUF748 domain-containing protein, partial [Pseudoxanthomonas sp.]|nr:DUF748 domain-containing protein [Pseudoxanthomonas sp.]